ncbi:hypothetical protein [Streptomyces sp. NPDC059893]|uniref:hypothetical protein n=1 Tax=Streptomyces sp. NPDC059893 TaxID=3346990 RepID=UPI003657B6A1
MREGLMGRRVETVGQPTTLAAKPQWQNLFLAPAYSDDVAEEIKADWEQETASLAVQRQRRGGQRTARPAA